MSNAPSEPRELSAYLRPVLKRWWLILAVVPLVTVATYLYYDDKPKTYQSSTQLYLQPSTVQQLVSGSRVDTQARVENYSLLILTAPVSERAEAILINEQKRLDGGKRRTPIPTGGVGAAPIDKSSFIVVTATSDTPRGAARIANAYATAFVRMEHGQVRREARQAVRIAENQLESISDGEETVRQREALEQKIQNLKLLAQQPSGGIRQVEAAVPIPVPLDHNPEKNAIFAFVVSMMLAIGAAYGLEYLNRKVSKVEDAEEIYGLPVLTEIPQVGAPAPRQAHGVAMATALQGPFQRLQMSLDLLAQERPLKTILVVSAAPEEGKSVVARNLGLAYREAGRSVAVVDADFRKASLGGMLASHEGLGLADILAGRASFGQVVQEVQVDQAANGNGAVVAAAAAAGPQGGELAMVPAGESFGGLAMAFSSRLMRQTLRTVADTYDTVIVDSSPLLATSDVLPLLSQADAVVLVSRIGVSTRESARRLLAELERVPGVFLAGVVVNGVPRRVYRARSYGYGDR